MNKINTKTIARIAAVQALYQYQSNHQEQSAEELITSIANYYKDNELNDDLEITSESRTKVKLNISHFTKIVTFAIKDQESIDQIIESHLSEGWKWENLHTTLIALLRASICELRYFPEIPYKVIINEFTNIASDMLKDNEVAFVNSLLDKVSKEFERA